MSDVISVISMIVVVVFWFIVITKLISDKMAPVRTEEAEVVDIYKHDTVSRYPGIFRRETYTVVFRTKYQKLSFSISCVDYIIGDKGMLKYKGGRIIDFK